MLTGMKNHYYILTTEKEMRNIESFKVALEAYKSAINRNDHVRLEKADRRYGTAQVIRSKNNIW